MPSVGAAPLIQPAAFCIRSIIAVTIYRCDLRGRPAQQDGKVRATMIYDKLTVALLGTLASERQDSTNSHIARYLLSHQDVLGDLTVKGLAQACSVGVGSVSRFCREVGFANFEELRQEVGSSGRAYEPVVEDDGVAERSVGLASRVEGAIAQAAQSVDLLAVGRLVDDLLRYQKVSAYGMLKAQAAAVDLQVDLLMQGKLVDTCVNHAEQLRRISEADGSELVIVFSYTGSYFDARDMTQAMKRLDQPKIWVVCGRRHDMPSFVSDRVLFSSSGSQLGHPYQLEMVAGIVAQEYARRLA